MRPATPMAHTASPKADTPAAAPPDILKPQNQARFILLRDVEAVGLSRTYTGEQRDPNTCAEGCLATKGCDGFSFDTKEKLCFMVGQITDLKSNSSFVSGRLK